MKIFLQKSGVILFLSLLLSNNIYADQNNNDKPIKKIPEKIIVFYGRTNPITKESWKLSVDELKERFVSYVEKKIQSSNYNGP